ncbi:MAG TPA: LPS export ABC transporter periplasmic protein LptC [Candidatus Acidoferrales bacterium]|nr:LPS export ABC transporter periplasmic protein LptC [Candidatus Acidoferrales bacterium]
MKNKEAARYARWSAGVAIAIVLVVFAIYLRGRIGARVMQKNLPAPVPASVAQESAGFAISRTVNHRVLFTVRASRATEYKDQNRSLLEDVLITIYGKEGDRDDSVRASECSYEPASGSIRCQGQVQVDLRNADATSSAQGMQLQTSNILFDHDSGQVSTPNDVTLTFPGGEGKGTGVVYDPQNEDVKLKSNVELKLTSVSRGDVLPVFLSGSALEFRRETDDLLLSGPVRATEGRQEITTGALELVLDAAMQPKSVVATGQPALNGKDARGTVSLTAEEMRASLGAGDVLEKIVASGNVHCQEERRYETNRLAANRVQLVMVEGNGRSMPREVLATGNVHAETQYGQVKRILETEAMRMNFAPDTDGKTMHVDTAETLAPGQVVISGPGESDQIRAGRLTAAFDAKSKLDALHGASGVEVIHAEDSKPSETTSAQNLTATFGAGGGGGGGWQTINEDGSVTIHQAGRTARAERARITRDTNQLILTGSAQVSDAASRLSASRIEMNQKTGEMRANDNVVASYVATKDSGDSLAKTISANVSADEMTGTFASRESIAPQSGGHATFSGHARFWQDSALLQGETIEFWGDANRAEARGNVLATFEEPADKSAKTRGPVVWQVRAPEVDYRGDLNRVNLSGGVDARSAKGTISSRTMELFLSNGDGGQRKLDHATAEGAVRIEQNGRIGTAEQGEYDAPGGKFTLSGGQPTVSDGSGNTTTGRELTFFLASDTILVKSKKGTRTVTMHRIAK